MRALVVEEDPVSAKLIHAALKAEGIVGDRAETGEDAIDLAKHYDFDVMILDLDLPDMEGFEVIRRLRSAGIATPALILSGMNQADDKVRGLATGADDYLTKPFLKSELIARIHAIVRRSKGHSESVIKTGKLVVNLDARSVDVDGRRLHVTSKEYSILELLSLRKGTTLTKEMFLDHLYGGIDEPELKIIDVLIAKLRKKIAAATGDQHYIETVWGRGYVLKDLADEINQANRLRDFSYYKNYSIERLLEEITDVIEPELLVFSEQSIQRLSSTDDANTIGMEIIEELVDIVTNVKKYFANNYNNVSDDIGLASFSRVEECTYRMYGILHRFLMAARQSKGNILAETTVTEGNLVKSMGSGGSDVWISETEFSSDAFKLTADFSRCLNLSETPRQRRLCNLIFIIEVARNAIGMLSQVIPFAGKK